jgi:surfactin synthase thioesterase subunit
MSRSWLACRVRRPNADHRVVCFAHSGGAVGEYLRWGDDLPDVEVWGVQLPGRGARLAEDSLESIEAIARAIADEAHLPEGAAFFGHSLGALVAYEVARLFRERGREEPSLLFLSSMPAPHLPLGVTSTKGLSDDALLDSLLSAYGYGSLVHELRDNPELQELVLPGLRADLDAAAAYEHRAMDPLAARFVVLGGADESITREELEAWRQHTKGPTEIHQFPGGHFWFRPDPREALAVVRRVMLEGRPSP